MLVQFRPGAFIFMNIDQEKEQIRAQMREKLKKQSAAERAQKSSLIYQKLKKEAAYQNAKTIMFYLSLETEVDTHQMVEDAIQHGKKVVVPCVEKEKTDLIPCVIKDFHTDLTKGNYGILEPKNEKIERVLPEELELVIVPGIVFDQTNNRIGKGKGYYDRFLAKLPRKTKTFGLAFDFQIVKELPVTELDIPVMRVIHN